MEPLESIVQRATSIEEAADMMESAGYCTFGVEYVTCADRSAAYVNTGDTYDTTIVAEAGRLFVSSWGSWYEAAEAEHCEKSGEIRCGYCGEFTPMDEEDWQDVSCAYCGNCVAG